MVTLECRFAAGTGTTEAALRAPAQFTGTPGDSSLGPSEWLAEHGKREAQALVVWRMGQIGERRHLALRPDHGGDASGLCCHRHARTQLVLSLQHIILRVDYPASRYGGAERDRHPGSQ